MLDAAEPDRAERLVQRAVELQHCRGEDPDDDGCVDRRQEDRRAEDSPARHAAVDHVRDDERQHELDRHGQREDRVVLQRVQEDRVLPEHAEVVQPDPLRGRDPVPAGEGVVEDAAEGIRDERAHEHDRRRGVEEAPQPLRAVGPPRAGRCLS